MRQLQFHEQKLLKKTNFLQWPSADTNQAREAEIMRRYFIQKREDYVFYNKMCGRVKHFLHQLATLPAQDSKRQEWQEALIRKLVAHGLVAPGASLSTVDKTLTVSAFCRRRLAVVMVRLRMAATVKEAVGRVQHGHVRVGPKVVLDPGMLVTRTMEDYVTWSDGSKIKRQIMRYNDKLDDYDLL